MAKRDKRKPARFDEDESKGNELGPSELELTVEMRGSSDDEEANEDLSLKIMQKALLVRAAKLAEDGGIVIIEPKADRDDPILVDLSSASSLETDVGEVGVSAVGGEAATDLDRNKAVKKKKKKTKSEKIMTSQDGENIETLVKQDHANDTENVENIEPNADNIVLRKLLRGPRYFDPPDSGWETCYNCGEEGHIAVNCTSASKRKKPCFVCGSLEHNAKQCSKAQNCFICKKSGHRAKDCPEKHKSGSKNGRICLRCGDSGHDMFSCRNEYSYSDLKDIQCYTCKNFGHLCCVNAVDTSPRESSCYRCGQLGHTGLTCGKLRNEVRETTGVDTPSSCYRCGEEGHFARECTTASKVGKRSREFSTPIKRHGDDKKNFGFKSAPHDHSKSLKKKKLQYEEKGITTPRKAKHRGGWITEDPIDFCERQSRMNSWRSPSSSSRGPKFSSRGSDSQSSRKKTIQRFSASRFGNFESNEIRRNYDWW